MPTADQARTCCQYNTGAGVLDNPGIACVQNEFAFSQTKSDYICVCSGLLVQVVWAVVLGGRHTYQMFCYLRFSNLPITPC